MITLELDENIVENFKAAQELKAMGFSDEQIQEWYDNSEERMKNNENENMCK